MGYPRTSVYLECGPGRTLSGYHSFNGTRIIGVTLVIYEPFKPSPRTETSIFDLVALKHLLKSRSALSFFVVAFGDFDIMQRILERYPELRNPFSEYCICTFAFRQRKNGGFLWEWVAIDPGTLLATGAMSLCSPMTKVAKVIFQGNDGVMKNVFYLA